MRSRAQSGFSLPELLTVVAIIGVISLVTIPSFITMYKTSKMKTSLRQFTGDFRSLRSRAVSTNRRTKMSFEFGGLGNSSYSMWQFDPEADDWVQLDIPSPKICPSNPNTICVDETVYFESTTFEDSDEDDDDIIDIIFRSNGTIDPMRVGGGEIVLQCSSNIPKNQYTLEINVTGRVKVEEGSF